MKRENPDIELTTLCYLEKDDSYLMMHRTKKSDDENHDKYIGVGGHVEEGETPEECIIREIREETGLAVSSLKMRGLLTFCIDSKTELAWVYTATEFDGELIQCDEGDLRWIPKSEINSLPLWEGDKIFLKLLEEGSDYFSLKLVYINDKLVEVRRFL